MYAITSGDLRVSCPFAIDELTAFEFSVVENEHGTAFFKALVSEKTGTTGLGKDMTGVPVTVSSASEVLFAGVIREVRILGKNGLCELSVTLDSSSRELDREKCSRSFQDVNALYSQVISNVLLKNPDADFIMAADDRPIGKPIIQYQETDWEFAKRLASHLETSLIPEITLGRPLFWLGMRSSRTVREFSDDRYSLQRISLPVLNDGTKTGYHREKILSYTVQSEQNCSVGDQAVFRGRQLVICRKSGRLVGDAMLFDYALGSANLIFQNRYGNERLRGCTLTGKVIGTKDDMVKLQLDIDPAQDLDKAFWFRWTPATGSILYLMPEINTEAALYFGDSEETSGRAFSNVRTEQVRNSGCMEDTSKRGLSTQHKKNLLLHSDKVGYVSDSGSVSAVLDDASGMKFQTPKQIEVLAKGKIQFFAPLVHIYTPINLGLYSTDGETVLPDDKNIRPPASMEFSGPTVNMYSKSGKAELKFGSAENMSPAPKEIHSDSADIAGQTQQVAGGMAFTGAAAQSAFAVSMETVLAVSGGVSVAAAAAIGGASSGMIGLIIGGKAPAVSMRKQIAIDDKAVHHLNAAPVRTLAEAVESRPVGVSK
jgi:hypothetical protein